ncbi:MAG: ribosome-associated translation inhibitor RaiA [Anaerolineales bacterium]|nr:ribosome-associated translation inhibitor RaiA [Anaerolineales bacterium]MCB8952358.1 ribosome-associated translation inhibitor RaiA [Ardenticatenales bacterium]
MDFEIYTHSMELTPRLENYVAKKTERLDRYMPNLATVRVDLTEQNARSAVERQIAQITIRDSRGTILRAEERSNDMFASIDAVIDKIYRQISRYRGKQRRNRRGAAEPEYLGEPLPLPEEAGALDEEGAVIVREKRFPLMPMSAQEAIDQMLLLGHDFYVFFNADRQAINVVYKRRDGNYGMLLPEMD